MQRGRHIDTVLAELARPTVGIFHEQAARRAGISPGAIRLRIRQATIARLVGPSIAVGPLCHDPTFEMQAMAAALALGPNGKVDGTTAAQLLGVWNRGGNIVHASSPDPSIPKAVGPYRFTRVRGLWLPESALQVGPVPLADPYRILATMAIDHTPWQVAYVFDQFAYRRLVDLAGLASCVELRRRSPGNKTLRAVIDLIRAGSVGTRSPMEDGFVACFLGAGIPMPLVNVLGAMGIPRDEPDFVQPSTRSNVECDGRHHDDPRQQRDDNERDVAVAALGGRVLRVRSHDYYRRRAYVERQVLRFLAGEDVPTRAGTTILLVP